MENDIENLIVNEKIETNEIISASDTNFLNIFTNLYTITSVLTFLIFVIFMYKYLKNCFSIRRKNL